MPAGPWWRDAVVYQIYVRSFADSDGDGVGDLPGITARLDHVVALRADAIWLTPFYPSPMADHGYDVADPRDVDPLFGRLDDFDALVTAAHDRGLRVIVDVVPNHTSSAHPWFQEALAAGPGSAARERYIFRAGRGADGSRPPNNWPSTFGGPAWTRVADGEWYLHLFATEQPDLNWRHPDVLADFERTLRFWLDRGVDGFRIDVAHGLVKDSALGDVDLRHGMDLMAERWVANPMWNQPEVHDIWRHARQVTDSYDNDRVLVGEVWLGDAHELAHYVRPDELHLAFNFRLLFAHWDTKELRAGIVRSIDGLSKVDASATWVLANHDVQRAPTRYGAGAVGLRRARAAALLLLALPGPAFVYAGEELGLPEVDLPEWALQDPLWEMTGHTVRGRDGCRVPLPWEGSAPAYGFSTTPETWLPMPDDWAPLTVAAETGDASSTLELYRSALALRRAAQLGTALEWTTIADPDVLDFTRSGTPGLRCIVNLSDRAMQLPPGDVLLSSDPLDGDRLSPDTAVWLRKADSEATGAPRWRGRSAAQDAGDDRREADR